MLSSDAPRHKRTFSGFRFQIKAKRSTREIWKSQMMGEEIFFNFHSLCEWEFYAYFLIAKENVFEQSRDSTIPIRCKKKILGRRKDYLGRASWDRSSQIQVLESPWALNFTWSTKYVYRTEENHEPFLWKISSNFGLFPEITDKRTWCWSLKQWKFLENFPKKYFIEKIST